jgi:D-alanyl-D-alanine carboxypeptidase/D-alanyl-D-alanine-endopeptidase (penicillin-binding protein 4)
VGRRDRGHGSRAWWRWGPVALVLVLLVAAGAAYRFDLGDRWFGTGEPDPETEPAAVPPPEGLSLPTLFDPPPVAEATDGSGLAPPKVGRALAPFLTDKDLGRRVFAFVADVGGSEGARHAYTFGHGTAIPASTTKLLTSTAALQVLGPDHTFHTRVVSGQGHRIVLVGGGDPLLARKPDSSPSAWPHRADIVTLARQTAAALRKEGQTRVTLSYDDSLFSGPAVNPHWPDDYVPDGVVSPITALWLDEGRAASGFGRVADPSATAAQEFANLLARNGVKVTGAPSAAHAARHADEIASVESAPLAQIVEWILNVSDNEGAEVLARQVGLATSGEGSSAAGTAGVLRTLDRLGVDTGHARVYDGSGLSRENRIDPRTLVDVLRVAATAQHPDANAVVTGLPVAGFTGSLGDRFADGAPAGRGLVHAKTGTLTGVSSLAGTVTDLDGTTMVFALMADRVKLPHTLDARQGLDQAAAALAACHCSAR